MSYKSSLLRFRITLIVAFGVLAFLPILAVGIKEQPRSGGKGSIPGHQNREERYWGDSIASTSPEPTGIVDAASTRKKTENARGYPRGLRVEVLLSDPMSGMTTGSGFWISSAGLVITCWRNLSQNPDGVIGIKSAGTAGQLMKGRLVAQDIHRNLALIKVEPNPFAQAKARSSGRTPRLRAATPAPQLPQIGDKLLVAVARRGRPGTAVQKQSVAAVRPVTELGGELKILLSGASRYGQAGEPVLDDSGRVIGILEGPYPSPDRTKWRATEVVIPIQAALELLKGTPAQLLEGAQSTPEH